MNGSIRTLLLVLIVAICSRPLPAGDQQRTPFVLLVPKVKEHVARISFSSGEFSGTGWFVAKGGKLLTCNHVLIRPDGTYDTSYVLEITSDIYINDTTLLRRDVTTRLKAKIDTIAGCV